MQKEIDNFGKLSKDEKILFCEKHLKSISVPFMKESLSNGRTILCTDAKQYYDCKEIMEWYVAYTKSKEREDKINEILIQELEYKASIFYNQIESLKYQIEECCEKLQRVDVDIYDICMITSEIETLEKAIKVLEKRNKRK